MKHYERYIGIINNLVALLREENSSEERMEYLDYIISQVLMKLLKADLLGVEKKSCERCNR